MFFRNLKMGYRRPAQHLVRAVGRRSSSPAPSRLFVHHGLPLGLSFTGGSTVEVKFSQTRDRGASARGALAHRRRHVDSGDTDPAKQARSANSTPRSPRATRPSSSPKRQATWRPTIARPSRRQIRHQRSEPDLRRAGAKPGSRWIARRARTRPSGLRSARSTCSKSLLALVIALGPAALLHRIPFRQSAALRRHRRHRAAARRLVMVGIYATRRP